MSMKVEELISRLLVLPQDLEVFFEEPEMYRVFGIDEVNADEDQKGKFVLCKTHFKDF